MGTEINTIKKGDMPVDVHNTVTGTHSKLRRRSARDIQTPVTERSEDKNVGRDDPATTSEYERIIDTYIENLKYYLKNIQPPTSVLPGYQDMLIDMYGWEDKNIRVFRSCLETLANLCWPSDRSIGEVWEFDENLFNEECTLAPEEFSQRWTEAWEMMTSSMAEEARSYGDMPGLGDGYIECFNAAKDIQQRVSTIPFPYITQKDLDMILKELQTIRFFAEGQAMTGAIPSAV